MKRRFCFCWKIEAEKREEGFVLGRKVDFSRPRPPNNGMNELSPSDHLQTRTKKEGTRERRNGRDLLSTFSDACFLPKVTGRLRRRLDRERAKNHAHVSFRLPVLQEERVKSQTSSFKRRGTTAEGRARLADETSLCACL